MSGRARCVLVCVILVACAGGGTSPGGGAGPRFTPSPSPTGPGSGNVLVVGPGRQYATLAAAVGAARDGDTIDVVSGTYTNDFAGYIDANVTIVGVGGMVHEVYTQSPPNDKSPLTVEHGLTLKNFEISGVAISAGAGNNGAGIRLEGGNLSVQYCYIHDNQDGILGGVSGGNVTLDRSEFSHNGAGDGFSHNIYIGPVSTLSVTNGYFHEAVVGHEMKSRAMMTTVSNTVIANGSTGSASYDIDIPNAGVALISNDVIEKGPFAQNPIAIHYGGETQNIYPTNSLTISGVTLINGGSAGNTAVDNAAAVLGLNTVAQLNSNSIWGFGTIVTGPGNVASSNVIHASSSGAPPINTTHPWSGAPVVPIP